MTKCEICTRNSASTAIDRTPICSECAGYLSTICNTNWVETLLHKGFILSKFVDWIKEGRGDKL